ncbi:MAG: phosphoribosylpyrophosphate synthetase [Gammaproteobacteria bacterium RIFCSPHIGHO2_12_FULL_63_22]|nr:MAG: phosphoribosylpyrophosphate synthetase [Gammaproteobacteria bacterium RIFCSPHIGHO2_12_FULL_63_22]
MNRILIPFPELESMGLDLAARLQARFAPLGWRRFPDGESLVTLDPHLKGSDVVLLAGLRSPDTAALALRFAAETAREFGARSVGLVAPYLPYMRQDTRFHLGEAISAPLFARFLQQSVDWLVTVDPHLHRNPRLDGLFSIPTRHVAAAPAMAAWVQANVPNAILIGPDSESAQWVGDIAARAQVPYQVLTKIRESDRAVRVSLPDPIAARGRTPVVVDDIVSSGHTMIETLKHLAAFGMAPATCLVTHAVFSEDAYDRLLAAGAQRVVSTDTIPHPACNAIAMAPLLAVACESLLAEHTPAVPVP